MKKLLIFIIALSLGVTSSAFALTTFNIDWANAGFALHGDKTTASATTALIGKTSTGVALGYFGDAVGTGYALVTQHKLGTKIFGTSYDSTSMYSAPITPANIGVAGGGVILAPTAITSADFVTGTWTSM
jgi:hypothetical protein